MKSDIDVAKGWIQKAESDLKTAEILISAGGPLDTCCFHTQQAAEKCLKAMLCLYGIVPPRTHDLGELADKCQKIMPDFKVDKELFELTEYAVGLRYDVEFWPDKETADQALMQAKVLFENIKKIISASLLPDTTQN